MLNVFCRLKKKFCRLFFWWNFFVNFLWCSGRRTREVRNLGDVNARATASK